VQENSPLRHKSDLGHGRHRPSDHDTRQPGVEQADPLHIGARQKRPEGAAENIGRTEQQHDPDAGRAAGSTSRLERKLAIQHEPDGDIDAAHQRQQAPPPGHGIRPGQGT
jgi:hypothetical protein